MITLRCNCCGIERNFADSEEAFRAGWDAPPHFSITADLITCDLCPMVCVLGHDTHTTAHALWERFGRPSEFSLDMCAGDSLIIGQLPRGRALDE